MAHIRKTTSGRFEARYRAADGTERARRFATKRDAQAFLDRVGVDRRDGAWRAPRAGRVLLRDWAEQWTATAVDLRASTRARDESYLRNHVLPRFGKAPIGRITTLEVQDWVV